MVVTPTFLAGHADVTKRTRGDAFSEIDGRASFGMHKRLPAPDGVSDQQRRRRTGLNHEAEGYAIMTLI
jgi:hypothetical protein